jgi:hypothetical protein
VKFLALNILKNGKNSIQSIIYLFFHISKTQEKNKLSKFWKKTAK